MFEVTVKYEKTLENGLTKKASEKYIMNGSVTFGEAEKSITKEMQAYISGDFEVSAVKKAFYQEIIKSNALTADKWYKVKINLLNIDEKTGNLKKQAASYLVQAATVGEAKENFVNSAKAWTVDYEIESISDTKIMDVYGN